MACLDWNETKSILHELESLFSRNDDIQDIEDIKKMSSEIEYQRSQHIRDAKDTIKQYTSFVSSKEKDILAPSESFHNSRLDELQLEKENLSLKINIVSGAIEQKCSVISEIVNDTLKNQSTISEYENVNILNESRTVYALSLYSKVSNISWDYASPSDHLCGCHGNDIDKELRNFDFDLKVFSAYEIANALWEMIEEGC